MNHKPSSLKQSHRFRELDGLRGVAILLVLVGHFSATYPVYFPSGQTPPFSIYFGGMGVQLFFMISGYVILMSALRQGSAIRYLINRAVRLYPAYWVGLAISSLIIATVGIEYKTITVPQVLINATMFQRFLFVDNVDDVYWTLAIEWQFYLLLFVLLVWKKKYLTESTVLRVAALWAFIGFLVCLWAGSGENLPMLQKLAVWAIVAEHAPLFGLGIACYVYASLHRFSWYVPYFAVLAVANCWLRTSVHYALVMTLLVAVFITVTYIRNVPVLSRGPVHFFGKISYSLYLTHNVLGIVVLHHVWILMGNYWVGFGAGLLSSTAVAWLMHIAVEQKFTRILKHKLLEGKR